MNQRIGLYCLWIGFCFAILGLGGGHLGWYVLSMVITGTTLLPVIRFGPQRPLTQFAVILLAVFVVGGVCTLSEAALFFPQVRPQFLSDLLRGTATFGLPMAALAALTGKALKLTDKEAQPIPHRSVPITVLMVLLAGIAYLIYYEVFGGIAYQFFTKQYYPHAAEQAMALGIWFPIYQLARGVVMTLAVLPIIYTLRLPRWQAALTVGLLVWIVGGGASLLVPNGIMVTAQRYIHIVEIFTQNFSLGVTAVWLLRPKKLKLKPMATPVTVA